MKTSKLSRLALAAALSTLAFSAAAESAGPRDQYGRLRVVVSADTSSEAAECLERRRVGPGNKGPGVPEYAWVNTCANREKAEFASFRVGPPFMWFGVKY